MLSYFHEPNHKQEQERFVAVLEEVERTEAAVTVDESGVVLSADVTFVTLYGNQGLVGANISTVLPGLQCPAELSKFSRNS